jgi:hypothetical protein
MSDESPKPRKRIHKPPAETAPYIAPAWLSTDEIEKELVSAAVTDSRNARPDADFARIDAYFSADPDETEAQYRRSLVRLLADLRPDLAELIGGPRRDE